MNDDNQNGKKMATTGTKPTDDKKIAHLEAIKTDVREEIKKRIEQRDRYSIQLTIALSVILGLAFSKTGFTRALIAAPLVSIYFTVLILYSYRVHSILAKYLREVIEPELAKLHDFDVGKELETYYKSLNIPGIRKKFFQIALIVTTVLPLLYLILFEVKCDTPSERQFLIATIAATVVYAVAVVLILWFFWKD